MSMKSCASPPELFSSYLAAPPKNEVLERLAQLIDWSKLRDLMGGDEAEVLADKGYASKANRDLLKANGTVCCIILRGSKSPSKQMEEGQEPHAVGSARLCGGRLCRPQTMEALRPCRLHRADPRHRATYPGSRPTSTGT